MNFIKRLKSYLNKSKQQQVQTKIIFERQCPNCTSRGMILFKDTSNFKTKVGESDEKN